MPDGKTYLYGVASAEAAQALLRPLGLPDGQAPVTTIASGGVAAIVSRYDGPPPASLPQPELMRQVTIHQRVIENVMEHGDILPTRFGTVLDSPDEVRSFLGHWGQTVAESLSRFSRMVEVEVAASWDLKRTLAGIAQDPEVVAAKAAAQQAPAENRTAQQIRVGQLVKQQMDRLRAAYKEKLLHEVCPLAADTQPNALVADELVFNVAFLLPRRAQSAFDAALERLDAATAGEISLRQVGPLPPYSFATVSVTRFDECRLAAGRALLSLPGEITEEAVLASYRRLARQCHPDQNAADPAAAKRFAALSAARSDLLSYCRVRAQAGSDGGPALALTIGRIGGPSATDGADE